MRKIPTRGSFASAVALCIVAVICDRILSPSGKTVLIPVALAVLISYALAPVMSWLERHRVPRLAGAGLVLLVILGGQRRRWRTHSQKTRGNSPRRSLTLYSAHAKKWSPDWESILKPSNKPPRHWGPTPKHRADSPGRTQTRQADKQLSSKSGRRQFFPWRASDGHFFLAYFLLISAATSGIV